MTKDTIRTPHYRLSILKRDNFTCTHCGKQAPGLHIHHKDNCGSNMGFTMRNDNSHNLKTLCPSCHGQLHAGVLGRNPELAKLREQGLTLQQIANQYGISRQRVYQILKN